MPKIIIFRNRESGKIKVLFQFPETLMMSPDQIIAMNHRINTALMMMKSHKSLQNYVIDLEQILKGGEK